MFFIHVQIEFSFDAFNKQNNIQVRSKPEWFVHDLIKNKRFLYSGTVFFTTSFTDFLSLTCRLRKTFSANSSYWNVFFFFRELDYVGKLQLFLDQPICHIDCRCKIGFNIAFDTSVNLVFYVQRKNFVLQSFICLGRNWLQRHQSFIKSRKLYCKKKKNPFLKKIKLHLPLPQSGS